MTNLRPPDAARLAVRLSEVDHAIACCKKQREIVTGQVLGLQNILGLIDTTERELERQRAALMEHQR